MIALLVLNRDTRSSVHGSTQGHSEVVATYWIPALVVARAIGDGFKATLVGRMRAGARKPSQAEVRRGRRRLVQRAGHSAMGRFASVIKHCG